MEADLKGYLKCIENVNMPDERAKPLSEYGSSHGAQRGTMENNIIAPHFTSAPLKALLCLPSAVWSSVLINALFCGDAVMRSAKLFIYRTGCITSTAASTQPAPCAAHSAPHNQSLWCEELMAERCDRLPLAAGRWWAAMSTAFISSMKEKSDSLPSGLLLCHYTVILRFNFLINKKSIAVFLQSIMQNVMSIKSQK